jgi:hypothetical protein
MSERLFNYLRELYESYHFGQIFFFELRIIKVFEITR